MVVSPTGFGRERLAARRFTRLGSRWLVHRHSCGRASSAVRGGRCNSTGVSARAARGRAATGNTRALERMGDSSGGGDVGKERCAAALVAALVVSTVVALAWNGEPRGEGLDSTALDGQTV